MEPDQLHALSIHELKRRQDLAQHRPAGAEGLQNLSKARTACNGRGERTSGLAHGHGDLPQATRAALQAAKPTHPANGHLEVRKHTARNWPVGKQLGCVSVTPRPHKPLRAHVLAPSSPRRRTRCPRQGADVDVWAGRAGPEEPGGHRGVLGPSGQGLGGTRSPGEGREEGWGWDPLCGAKEQPGAACEAQQRELSELKTDRRKASGTQHREGLEGNPRG